VSKATLVLYADFVLTAGTMGPRKGSGLSSWAGDRARAGGSILSLPKEAAARRNYCQETTARQLPTGHPTGTRCCSAGFPEEISGDASATSIHLLDLKTHQTSMLPGSEGLYCPRWSPDGRYISATTADGRKLMLFDATNRKWTEPENLPEGCPAWSRDGEYLYFQSFDVKEPAFFRMRVSNRKRERLAAINLRRVVPQWFWWNGLAPDDSPLLLRDESSEEIYALDWLLP
jgi:dipeptidyl aminopeptidase/acylaminoacyl peptidase